MSAERPSPQASGASPEAGASVLTMVTCLRCQWKFYPHGMEFLCGTCRRDMGWAPRNEETDAIDRAVHAQYAHELARRTR